MKKLFRKYPNRRLYDVEKKEYVNLDDIKQDIMNFVTVEVVDVKTKKDITNGILLQIINKQDTETSNKVMTSQALISLIMLYNSPLMPMLSAYIEYFLSWVHLNSLQQNNSQKQPNNDYTQQNQFFNHIPSNMFNPFMLQMPINANNTTQPNPMEAFFNFQNHNAKNKKEAPTNIQHDSNEKQENQEASEIHNNIMKMSLEQNQKMMQQIQQQWQEQIKKMNNKS